MNFNNKNRRLFLSDLGKAGLALAMGTGLPLTSTGKQSFKKKGNEIMVFSKALDWLPDYGDLCQIVAESGFDGIELTLRPDGHVLPERVEEDLPKAVEAAEKSGIKIIMIATAISDPDYPYLEKTLRTASNLGIGMYRMGGISYSNDRSVEKNLAEIKLKFKDLADINSSFQIHGAYQNHAGGNRFSASIWDLWLVLKELDPQFIGCQYDTRHAQLEGGGWWPLGIDLLQEYIHTSVVKDFKWIKEGQDLKAQNCPVGTGAVNFEKHFELMKKNDLNGPISLHYPYPYLEEPHKLNKKERWSRTVEVMKREGISPLQKMV